LPGGSSAPALTSCSSMPCMVQLSPPVASPAAASIAASAAECPSVVLSWHPAGAYFSTAACGRSAEYCLLAAAHAVALVSMSWNVRSLQAAKHRSPASATCDPARIQTFSVLTARCCPLHAGYRLAAAVSAAGGAWVLLFASGEQLVQECCWSNLADQRATGKGAQPTHRHTPHSTIRCQCSPSAAVLGCSTPTMRPCGSAAHYLRRVCAVPPQGYCTRAHAASAP
jgi:hypothetical protein